MQITFHNIVKSRIPFVIQIRENFTIEYAAHLSASAKRFFNRSMRTCHYTQCSIDLIQLTQKDMEFLLRPPVQKHFKFSAQEYLRFIQQKNAWILKIRFQDSHPWFTSAESAVAYNLLWDNPQPNTGYLYCACPYIISLKKDANIYTWFKTIMAVSQQMKGNYLLDIGFEKDQTIINDKLYNFEDIHTFASVVKNRQRTKGYNNADNNSKFMFLTTLEKNIPHEPYLMVVCTCGQKILLDISKPTLCFQCQRPLNNIHGCSS